jgi:hypothetical protein
LLAADAPAAEELSFTCKQKLDDLEIARIEIQERVENVKAIFLANRVLEQTIRAFDLDNIAAPCAKSPLLTEEPA